MKPIAIIYGSNGGTTQSVARSIAQKIQNTPVEVIDVSKVLEKDFERFDNFILGTSTWGLGDIQDDWSSFIPKLKQIDLKSKTIALFGVGDSVSYSDTFVDGMGTLYESILGNCSLIGETPNEGYNFSSSTALQNGTFVGLALDEDNESSLTSSRINAWLSRILTQFQ